MREREIHPIQAEVLKFLLFKPKARYSELNITRITSDHFNFHIKQLLKEGLVIKTEDGLYELTTTGKEFANRFDTQKVEIERQAKIGVCMLCKHNKHNETYLVQQRLKKPYYGYFGFITGKITWGETVYETAKRELKEETGLNGSPKLVGIEHKMDFSKKDKTLLEDKFFFIIKVANLNGELAEEFDGGKNIWMPKKEILKLPNLFHDVPLLISMVEKETIEVLEKKYYVESY